MTNERFGKTQNNMEVTIAEMSKDITYIAVEVGEIKKNLSGGYVTKEEFEPIKKVVYGLVSLVVTAVVVALIGSILVR